MAEIEKQEFSFPDEVEKKSEVEDDGGVDVEIQTSTKETKSTQSNDDDEIDKYDEKVKKRISDLQSGFHNERRRAEESAREKDEALAFAQSIAEENKKLRPERIPTGHDRWEFYNLPLFTLISTRRILNNPAC